MRRGRRSVPVPRRRQVGCAGTDRSDAAAAAARGGTRGARWPGHRRSAGARRVGTQSVADRGAPVDRRRTAVFRDPDLRAAVHPRHRSSHSRPRRVLRPGEAPAVLLPGLRCARRRDQADVPVGGLADPIGALRADGRRRQAHRRWCRPYRRAVRRAVARHRGVDPLGATALPRGGADPFLVGSGLHPDRRASLCRAAAPRPRHHLCGNGIRQVGNVQWRRCGTGADQSDPRRTDGLVRCVRQLAHRRTGRSDHGTTGQPRGRPEPGERLGEPVGRWFSAARRRGRRCQRTPVEHACRQRGRRCRPLGIPGVPAPRRRRAMERRGSGVGMSAAQFTLRTRRRTAGGAGHAGADAVRGKSEWPRASGQATRRVSPQRRGRAAPPKPRAARCIRGSAARRPRDQPSRAATSAARWPGPRPFRFDSPRQEGR
ncbi:hypothetical protein HLY00_2864 [Mycolicibacterium hippocampi]|uniref:Uncharacterized protein n=1 Tax=Mycolicibacterium hippocampi TaxID=659824 RepID=A0A850PTA7_9MYCO|nr:hypothetical protein [Mycolicibacterium hippocampi]